VVKGSRQQVGEYTGKQESKKVTTKEKKQAHLLAECPMSLVKTVRRSERKDSRAKTILQNNERRLKKVTRRLSGG